jgi:transposase
VIRPPVGCRVFVRTQPTDLRNGYAGLAGLVQREMGHDLLVGDLFLFLSRKRNAVKILRWDGTGLCLFCKRLARGRFAPLFTSEHRPITLTRSDLQRLIQGVDITRDGRWRN